MTNFTIEELAKLTNSSYLGNKDHIIIGVNTLDSASSSEASFLANPRYEEAMKQSKAGVICINADAVAVEGKNFLISEDPSATFQKIAEILLLKKEKLGFRDIHPSAVIHPTAKIGNNVTIAPHAVIDQDVILGDNTVVGAGCYIGCSTTVGNNCCFYANSVVREACKIGNNVILQPGAIIGSCGFGYIPDKSGNHMKLEQLGIVIIEDDVEIGANSTVDRARFKATIIRKGTKIDNLVQIAHNSEIGESNIISAQSGVAGSAKTGKHVMLGGQVGVLGHVEITDMVMIATRGGVSKSLKKPGKYRGSPAINIHEYNRQQVHIRKLEKYVQHIKNLEEKIEVIEKQLDLFTPPNS
ncbi:MAG: UDP-3-O-(3-hydroxymyristoyl)glucosamine N-acyltransferase [Chlamydiota bacterium]|jgi:UDP-3-O-[3-hydroxymyristoyl] glucosamine N-acyltransferase